MVQNIVSRFAPSPTGRLHLGHAWSALQAHDCARAAQGSFLLRIEDIDQSRCRAEFIDGIFEDVRWLGLNWDGDVMVQSQRMEVYAEALDSLIARGLVYRCWCTRAEIAASAGAPQGDEGPVYPGTCKGRTDPGGDRAWCWRLDVGAGLELLKEPLVLSPSKDGASTSSARAELGWADANAGFIAASPGLLGDVVIARKDVATSYHLSVVVDDAAQGVTDVVRGRDLYHATHIHRLLQALLGLPTPRYHHHPLIAGADGDRLAKRRKAPTLQALREDGVDPVRLITEMREGRFPFGFALIEG